MDLPPLWLSAHRVVHVAGLVTGEVARFLGPASCALGGAGHAQTIVMIDELRCRPHLANLHADVEFVFAPRLRNPLRQWQALQDACRAAMVTSSVHAVHLHGVLPGVIGARVARQAQPGVPLFFSPHGSRALRGAGRLLMPLLWPWRSAAIINRPDEANAFSDWRSTDLVEFPVSRIHFEQRRQEARYPLIVAGGTEQSPRNVELLAQLAVLLSGEESLRVSFNWVGEVDPVSRARLHASGVAVYDAGSAADVAARLSGAWVAVMPGPARGFSHFLAEAMASGLACVAFDNRQHRALIRDGDTGFLCRDERSMMERIAELIDDEALRIRVGAAARADAQRRFGEGAFAAKLLAAYEVRGRELLDAAALEA